MTALRKLVYAILAVGSVSVVATAAPLVTDDFNRADAWLDNSGNGWVRASSTTSTNSMQLVSGKLQIDDNATRDYAIDMLPGFTTGSRYFSFDLTVSGTDAPSSGPGQYFAMFGSGSGNTLSNHTARLFLAKPANDEAGKFRIGIEVDAVNPTFWASLLDTGSTYHIVVGFDHDQDIATLWVDPTNQTSASIAKDASGITTELTRFALRANDTSDGDKTIDNLLVATTFVELVPEPTTLAAAALLMTSLRRRR